MTKSAAELAMHLVNVHEAKTHLSRLLEIVERGGEVVIARAGQPVATLVAYRPPRRKIAAPGSMKGRDWKMADDFDAPIDELFSVFGNESGSMADAGETEAAVQVCVAGEQPGSYAGAAKADRSEQ